MSPRKGQKAPGTGWGNPSHPMHTQPKGKGVWKQHEAGNVAALVHGARSLRLVDPVAVELVAEAQAELPYLGEAKYRATLEAWGRAEARVRLLERFLETEGLLTSEGDVRAAAAFQLQCETQAARLRSQLGLTPEAAAKIGKDVAGAQADLATIWARMADEGSTDGD